MADEEKIDVIITFDPENPKRNETKESLPLAEAYAMIDTGRARRADEEKASKKAEKSSTLT